MTEVDIRVRVHEDREEHSHKHSVRLIPGFGPTTEQTVQKAPLQSPCTVPFMKENLLATFTMSDTQQSVFSVTGADKRGNPAPLPTGTITWAVDQVSLLTLTPAADNLSCVVMSVGPLGTATVSVKVAAADGTTIAAGSIDVTITGGAATVITVAGAAPTEQP